jgi:hypothetical protein
MKYVLFLSLVFVLALVSNTVLQVGSPDQTLIQDSYYTTPNQVITPAEEVKENEKDLSQYLSKEDGDQFPGRRRGGGTWNS